MKKFLICEDDPELIELLNIFLSSEGHQYMIVEEGAAVVPAIKYNDIQFLLLDMKLPDIDGREVIREIRNDPEIKDIPIIVFTASVNGAGTLKQPDIDGYIEKPFKLAELENIINKYMVDK